MISRNNKNGAGAAGAGHCSSPSKSSSLRRCTSVPPPPTREADELRQSLQRSQLQLADLQKDRNYHAAKAKELGTIFDTVFLSGRSEQRDLEECLIENSLKVAELRVQVEELHGTLRASTNQVNALVQNANLDRSMVDKMSQMLWALTGSHYYPDAGRQGSITTTSGSSSRHISSTATATMTTANGFDEKTCEDDEDNYGHDDDDFDDEDVNTTGRDDVCSAEEALSMTLSTLRAQVQAMKEERDMFTSRIHLLEMHVEEQHREIEARALKIVALEKQLDS